MSEGDRRPAGSGSSPVLEVIDLSRSFTTRSGVVEALSEVSLTIAEGEIVGLLGLNGAGKTTMLKVVATLLLPTRGTVRVDGFDVVRETRRAQERLAVVLGGERGFYNRLSGRDNIRFFATLDGLPRRLVGPRCDEALERVGLHAAADRPVETYSKGMRQRLHLAVGLLGTPRLLMLDEPTLGLDPIEAERLRLAIAELRGSTAVLLTSHYLRDIERLASRVVVLQRGRVTHDLPLERLLAQAGAAAEITVTGTGPPPSPETLAAAAGPSADGVRVVGVDAKDGGADWEVRFEIRTWTSESLRALARAWPDRDVVDVRIEPASLERVFAQLTAGEAA